MSKLVEEIREWNTPIVGAYLLWRFSKGFADKHPNSEAPVAILHFIASAILTSEVLACHISRRRKNLEAYVRGFTDDKKTDVLACLQQRVVARREYTMAAIDIALSTGLLAWDVDSARLFPLSLTERRGVRKLSAVVQVYGEKAEILGEWFSEHDVSSIVSCLGVVL